MRSFYPARAQRYRLGLAALWLGWALACVALLGLGFSALSGRTWSLLTSRHNQALAAAEDLRSAFQALEGLPRQLVTTARDAAEGGSLGAERLARLRAEGQPFCDLYFLDGSGQPKNAGDVAPPAWLWQMTRRRLPPGSSGVQVLRPLPPGLEAGRQSIEMEEDTPATYLAVAARVSSGDVLLADLDLQHVFGPWLKKWLERRPLGESLRTSEENQGGWPEAPPPPSRPGWWPWASHQDSTTWTWNNPTFFASSPHPFEPLVLIVDNQPALFELRREMLGLGSAAAAMMALFALSIGLTGRAVRREVQYAEARSRFTEMVSHELRTPLSAISMYAEILREGLVDDPQKVGAYHALLASETERLKRLVEDVLTFGQLEGGAAAVCWQPTNLAQVAEQATGVVSSLGAKVEVAVEPLVTVTSDPGLLVSILVNLLENAAKHAGIEQPIELACRVDEHDIVWEVRDRGPGVPEGRRSEIFQPYTRVLCSSGAKKAGVGLGLTVVDGLARCLRGRVECRPRDGGGSIFVVTLPRMTEEALKCRDCS